MYAAFLPIILILAAGFAYRFLPGAISASDVRRVIGAIVLNIFLPALTFFALYSAPVTDALWTVPLTSAIVTLVGLGVAYVVFGRFLRHRLSRPAIGALLLASAWCNATYIGLPVVTSVIGSHVQHVPILFDLLAMTPLLFIAGSLIGVTYGASEGVAYGASESVGTKGVEVTGSAASHTTRIALRQVLTLPPLWAALAGLLLNAANVALPAEFTKAFEIAGRAVTPLMIFSVGLALRVPSIRRLPFITPAVGIRLVIGTLVGWLVASVLISDIDTFKATVLESAMPTMMLTMVFAERYRLDTELLAETIILSTLCSMITLPIIAHLL